MNIEYRYRYHTLVSKSHPQIQTVIYLKNNYEICLKFMFKVLHYLYSIDYNVSYD